MSLKTIWMLRTITMRADGDPGRIARIDAFFGIFSVFGLEHGLRFIKEDAQRTDLPRMGPFYSETSGATLRYVLVNLFRCARSLPSNWFMPLDGRQDWATDDGQGCNECNRTVIAQKEKTPVKLRANKNLCIFIDMQSAVAGRRWRREERTCVCASVSAALPWHLEGVGCLVLQKGVVVRRSTCLAYCRIA